MIIKMFNYFFNRNSAKQQEIAEGVKHSLQKYEQTYKLLEEYDKQPEKSPEDMAGSGRLRELIREFQREAGVRRTNSAI